MASNWNRLMDRLARTPLSKREGQVVGAIARKTLGYYKTSDRLSASQLSKLTGLQRSHVTETLKGLEQRDVVSRTGGGKGRAGTLELNLKTDWKPRAQPEHVPESGQVNMSRRRDTSAREPVPKEGSKHVPASGHTRGKGVNDVDDARASANATVDPDFDALVAEFDLTQRQRRVALDCYQQNAGAVRAFAAKAGGGTTPAALFWTYIKDGVPLPTANGKTPLERAKAWASKAGARMDDETFATVLADFALTPEQKAEIAELRRA